jgi:hypothetical protein
MMLRAVVPTLAVLLPGSPNVGADQVDKLEDRQVCEAQELDTLAENRADLLVRCSSYVNPMLFFCRLKRDGANC